MIEVKNLSKSFKYYKKEPGLKASIKALFHRKMQYVHAIKDISFTIEQGELVGFIGPNGAGKTTTLKTLSGLLYPTEGTVQVLGYNPYERNPDFLKQITLVMGQKSHLWQDLPPIDTFKLHKEIYEVPDEEYDIILNELVDMLDIREVMYRQGRKLSLGQRMKCELVAALLYKPKILFLDEPTIGLDVVMQKKVREFIKSYNKRYNATVILTSHYMDDVKEICDRVIMINHGGLIFDGKTSDLIKTYADYKILIPTFHNPVEKKDMEKFGSVVEFNPLRCVIRVKREEASKKASELLSEFSIDDIDINEPKLEDIIQLAFATKK